MDKYLINKICLSFITSFTISLFFTKFFIKKIYLKQFIRLEGPKSHYSKSKTPTMGGIIFIFSTNFTTLIWSNLENKLIWIIIFSNISFGLIGFLDDYLMQINKKNLGLNIKEKLIFQIIIASIITYFIINLPNNDTRIKIILTKKIINFGIFYIPFLILIIVGTTNAVNLTDGLDGMSIGITIITKITFIIIIIINTQKQIDYLSINDLSNLLIYIFSFIASGLGFLWFNSYPAEIFMGDTGSLSLGASLAVISILTKNELILILIGGIFVIETASVIIQIIFFKYNNKRIFRMAPIHHHFELSGLHETKIVSRFYIISIVLALISIIITIHF